MIPADELNVFQFIPERKASIIGINVIGKTFTIFFDNNPDSEYTIRGLMKYINQCPELKDQGNAFYKHIEGHPKDLGHNLTHACDDKLQKNHHIHLLYKEVITPAFIDLLVNATKTVEKSPELRAQYCVKPFINQLIDFLSGEGFSSYNASKPVRYLFNDDKKRLQNDFRQLVEEGLMKPEARVCSSEPVLHHYLSTPMFRQCLPNDARHELPLWMPSASEAHQQDLDTVHKLDNTVGRARASLDYLDTLVPLMFVAYALLQCCTRQPQRRAAI